MKKIIRLTESDLTRIVKRTIKEMRFSDDEEFDSENELSSYDVCKNMGYLVHNDFATGMLTKEKVTEILYNYRLTASRYFRKKLISSEEYQEISDCYEESMSELENPEYNKLNEMENKDDENFWGRVKLDFGRPKDFTAILSDISDLFSYLISNSAGVEEFETQVNEFIQDNQEDIDNLTDNERNRLDGFINGVKTRYNFN